MEPSDRVLTWGLKPNTTKQHLKKNNGCSSNDCSSNSSNGTAAAIAIMAAAAATAAMGRQQLQDTLNGIVAIFS